MELSSGTVLRDYQILKSLGEGGMGEVYLVEEALLGRKFAIKRLSPFLTKDSEFYERFKTEARILAKLSHPNIVHLHSFFCEDGIYYLVMEYAEGITLKKYIQINGSIPERRAMMIFQQIMAALHYEHSVGIVHWDIKPSNIMIDPQDKVRIIDFGIARLSDEKHSTPSGSKFGTLFYISPEQVKARKDIDNRTDIFSTGIVLYEMLTGKIPYSTDTDSDYDIMHEIMTKELPDPRKEGFVVSDQCYKLLRKMTEKDREKRPNSTEVMAFLDKYLIPSDKPKPEAIEKTPEVELAKKPDPIPEPKKHHHFILVEGGTFKMGNTPDHGYENEKPLHEVTVSSFFMCEFPLTQREWKELMGSNPSDRSNERLPIDNVTWFGAIEYCNRRSIKEKLEPAYNIEIKPITLKKIVTWNRLANGYRLPTEAEWEFAARGGNFSREYKYAGNNNVNIVAWYWENSGSKSHEVGQKPKNELGLRDMSGNVWEWCWDWYDEAYYAVSPKDNPTGPLDGAKRVLRGGSFLNNSRSCRVANRNSNVPTHATNLYGLRLCRNGD